MHIYNNRVVELKYLLPKCQDLDLNKSTPVNIPFLCGDKRVELEGATLNLQSVYSPALTYGHRLWVGTRRTRSQLLFQSFLCRVAQRRAVAPSYLRGASWGGLGICTGCLLDVSLCVWGLLERFHLWAGLGMPLCPPRGLNGSGLGYKFAVMLIWYI